MSPNERHRFISTVSSDPALFYDMVSKVDVRRSEAFIQADRDRIHQVVEELVGFDNLNRLVVSCLRKCYLALLASVVQQHRRSSIACSTTHSVSNNTVLQRQLRSLGCMYQSEVLYSEAELMFNDNITMCTVLYGAQGAETIEALYLRAKLSMAQGHYRSCLDMLDNCNRLCTPSRNQNHAVNALFLSILLTTAEVFAAMSRFTEAMDTLTVLGQESKTVADYSPLENELQSIQRLEMEWKLHGSIDTVEENLLTFRAAVQTLCEMLGKDHPTVLDCTRRLAILLPTSEVGELLKACVDNLTVKLGRQHPTTLYAVLSLGHNYLRCNSIADASKACDLFEECYRGRKLFLGKTHPLTIAVLFDLKKLSDNLPAAIIMILISVVAFGFFIYIEMSIVNGFSYGIDNYSSTEQTILLASAFCPVAFLGSVYAVDEDFLVGAARPKGLFSRIFAVAFLVTALNLYGSLFAFSRVVRRDEKYINILYFILMTYAALGGGLLLGWAPVKLYSLYYVQPRRARREEVMRQFSGLDLRQEHTVHIDSINPLNTVSNV